MKKWSLCGYSLFLLLVIATSSFASNKEKDYAVAYQEFQKGNYGVAFTRFQKLANVGEPRAQFLLGWLYFSGNGTKENSANGLKWFTKSAESGLLLAQAELARMYFVGDVIPQNDVEAFKWAQKAAMQGHSETQSLLAFLYFAGFGVHQDFVMAHMWANLAMPYVQGITLEKTLAVKNKLDELLTPDERALAQKMAREWKPVQ